MLPVVKTILYATDLSKAAENAFGFALGVAQKYGAELTVLHVIPDLPHEYGLAAGFDFIPDFDKTAWDNLKKSSEEKAKTALEGHAREICTELGVSPISPNKLVVRNGNPVDVIVDEGRKADLVVMGTQGHGVFGGLFVGSVTQGVLAKSETAVMIVRAKK